LVQSYEVLTLLNFSVEIYLRDQQVSIEVEYSGKASKPGLRYRKGVIKLVLPEKGCFNPEKIILDNEDWVLDRWNEAQKFREKVPERKFEDGASIETMGTERKLVVEKRQSNAVEDDRILLAQHLIDQTCLKDQLEKALRNHCREVIHRKLEAYVSRVDGDYEKVFIRDQDTRWGSCSSKNNLNFNWRLILGPDHVLDYLVVHEIVHLEIKNHGQTFWERVEELRPDYRKSRDWLKQNNAKLVFDSNF